jgi:hypothetical protein
VSERKIFFFYLFSSCCCDYICGDGMVYVYDIQVKSPQQIMGALLKNYFASKLNKKANEIYHTTIMPCFDKKLEASREDFFYSETQCREVDCVLTSTEILSLIDTIKIDFCSLEESELDPLFMNMNENENLYGNHGGSGGYAEVMFRFISFKVFNQKIETVPFQNQRNSDFKVFFFSSSSSFFLFSSFPLPLYLFISQEFPTFFTLNLHYILLFHLTIYILLSHHTQLEGRQLRSRRQNSIKCGHYERIS